MNISETALAVVHCSMRVLRCDDFLYRYIAIFYIALILMQCHEIFECNCAGRRRRWSYCDHTYVICWSGTFWSLLVCTTTTTLRGNRLDCSYTGRIWTKLWVWWFSLFAKYDYIHCLLYLKCTGVGVALYPFLPRYVR